MICSTCQRDNPEGNVFCGGCGLQLISACGHCHAANPPASVFCGKCGQRLAPADEPESEEPERGERRQLTVLFCDLVGSTDLAARLDPEEYREALRAYHDGAAEVLQRYDGYVARHLGDGLLVYFGWPQAHDDAGERAVRAGLELVAATALVCAGGAPLATRVGLHTGAVVLSNLGSRAPQDTLALGDTPNLAAGAQAAAQPGEVLITAATQRLVSGRFVVEERGLQRLKGVAQPVELYRVVQSTGVRGRLAAAAARGFTPFVNRVEERALLRSRFERACEGDGQVVVLSGEAGIGKSRLAQVLREEIADTPHTWLETGGSPHFANTPFHVVAELLRQRRPWDEDDAGERAKDVARALSQVGIDPNEALPLVAPLLDLPLPDGYARPAASPEIGRRRLLGILATWVFAMSRLQPLVILIEDLHWIDPSSLELLELLVVQGATAPLLLLGTARPQFQVPWPLRAHHTQLTLNHLSKRHVRDMVAGVAAQEKLLAEVIEAVAARTDGVPLFVEELTKAVLETGTAVVTNEIPSTLADSLMARLDLMGTEAKEVAQVAAVCGRHFTLEMIRALHPSGEESVEPALRKLVDADLLHASGLAPDVRYAFKHALLQDTAYDSLLKSRRKALHAQVAETLTAQFPAEAAAHPELLAHHHESAAQAERAIDAWQRAGEQALERGADREAERYVERGIALLGEVADAEKRDWHEFQLQLMLGKARLFSRGLATSETEAPLSRAMELGERIAEPLPFFTALLSYFVSEIAHAGPSIGRPLSQRMLRVAKQSGFASLDAVARFAVGLVEFHSGDLSAARRCFVEAMNDIDEPVPLAVPVSFPVYLRTFLAEVSMMLGYADRARAITAEAVERAGASQRVSDLAWAAHRSAVLNVFLRRPEASQADARRALAACEMEPNPTCASVANVVLGWSLSENGDPAAGRELVRRGIDELIGTGQRLGLELCHCLLADTHAAAGDIDAALRVLAEGETTCPDQLVHRPWTLERRAALLVRAGAPAAEIDTAFDTALEWARRQRARTAELRIANGLARWRADDGRAAGGRELLTPIYASFTEGFDLRDLREARALLSPEVAARPPVPVKASA